MIGTWLVITPPLIVLLIAFISRNLNLALAIGLTCSALIATHGNIIDGALLLKKHAILLLSDPDNWYIYGFLCIIGIIIVLLSRTGGANAFAHVVTKHLTTPKSVENASIMLSCSIFIDDYLSNLTVGYVMRPLTDKYNIARVKLAFLVHSLASPLVILAPVSSWAGAMINYVYQSGIALQLTDKPLIIADPFFVYLSSIPFILYSLLLFVSAVVIVHFRYSYGPMRTHELIARETGNLFGGKQPIYEKQHPNTHENASVFDLLLPLITLIGGILIGTAYAGNYWLFGGTNSLLDAFKNNPNPFLVMLIAGITAVCIGFLFSLSRTTLKLREVPTVIYYGIALMYSTIIMIFLVNTLSTVLKVDLLTGQYLADLLTGTISINLLPLMFFISAFITATLIGSSWGTIGLLMPVAVQMLTRFSNVEIPATLEQMPLIYPLLGSIFAGAVCGNHISPVSETTSMSSTSSGSYPIDHTYTQLPYALPAILGTCVGFFAAGMLVNYPPLIMYGCTLGSGLIVTLTLLYLLNKFYRS